VVGVCSLAAGLDGVWGTADDTYTSPVATVTAPDGTYHLDLVGEACWATIAPPDEYEDTVAGNPDATQLPQPVDVSGSATTSRTVVLRRVPASASSEPAVGVIGDTVWNDANGDGVQDVGEPGIAGVLLTLLDEQGHNVATATSDAAGVFGFDGLRAGTYRLGAANLPEGLMFTDPGQGRDVLTDSDADPVTGRTKFVTLKEGETFPGLDIGLRVRPVDATDDATADVTAEATAASTVKISDKVLPAPSIHQLAVPASPHSTLSIFVLILAGFLALSMLLGLVRPRSRRAA
jgi:hypothetical protein